MAKATPLAEHCILIGGPYDNTTFEADAHKDPIVMRSYDYRTDEERTHLYWRALYKFPDGMEVLVRICEEDRSD